VAGGPRIPSAQDGLPNRPPLSPRRITAASIDYIDEFGLPELTMRKVAATLGVEAMSLYKHINSRDELLDGIVDTVLDELTGDPAVRLKPDTDWQNYLRRLAYGLRRIALKHPQVFPLIATRPPAAPWIRPPLRSLRWIEAMLAELATNGFTAEQAVDAYKAFTSFLLGHLLLEVAQLDVPIGPEETSQINKPDPPVVELDSYPTVQQFAGSLAKNTSAAEFEASLENLLDRLAGPKAVARLHDGSGPQDRT
jgi:AcrR family transcriptional regulator